MASGLDFFKQEPTETKQVSGLDFFNQTEVPAEASGQELAGLDFFNQEPATDAPQPSGEAFFQQPVDDFVQPSPRPVSPAITPPVGKDIKQGAVESPVPQAEAPQPLEQPQQIQSAGEAFRQIPERYELGVKEWEVSQELADAIGKGTELEIDELAQRKDAVDQRIGALAQPRNFWDKLITAPADMAAGMWHGGVVPRVKGALVGAGGAAVAGAALPIPEEIVTIPGGAAWGAKWLGGAESSRLWWKQGTAEFYTDMREDGLDHDTSKIAAQIGAIPYAAVELMQFSKLVPGALKNSKAFKNTWRTAIKKGTAEIMKKGGRDYLINIAQESGEEGLQEVIKDITSNAAKEVSDRMKGTAFDKKGVREILEKGMSATIEAVPAMVVFGLGGAVTDTGVALNRRSKVTNVKQQAENFQNAGATVEQIDANTITATYPSGKTVAVKFQDDLSDQARANPVRFFESVRATRAGEKAVNQAALATEGDENQEQKMVDLLIRDDWLPQGETTGATTIEDQEGNSISVDQLIQLEAGYATEGVAQHELWHTAKALADVTPEEQAELDEMFGGNEEAEAYAFERYADQNPVLKKVDDFITFVKAGFRKTGEDHQAAAENIRNEVLQRLSTETLPVTEEQKYTTLEPEVKALIDERFAQEQAIEAPVAEEVAPVEQVEQVAEAVPPTTEETTPVKTTKEKIRDSVDIADDSLNDQAEEVIGRFVGIPRDVDIATGVMDANDLEDAVKNNDRDILDELQRKIAPVKKILKEEFGNSMTLFRAQSRTRPIGAVFGIPRERSVLSWTSNKNVAKDVAGLTPVRPLWTEQDIQDAENAFNKDGEVALDNGILLKTVTTKFQGEDETYIGIFDDDVGGLVTDTDSVRSYMESTNEDRQETMDENDKIKPLIREEQIPIDDIIWVTERAGQSEYIVKTSEDRELDFAPIKSKEKPIKELTRPELRAKATELGVSDKGGNQALRKRIEGATQPKTETKDALVGKDVRVQGFGNQSFEVVKKIPQTEIEAEAGEQFYEVRNKKTKEVESVLAEDINAKAKTLSEMSRKEIFTEAKRLGIQIQKGDTKSFVANLIRQKTKREKAGTKFSVNRVESARDEAIKDAKEFDLDFDTEEWVLNMSDGELEDLIPSDTVKSAFFDNPTQQSGTVFHQTTSDNWKDIQKSGKIGAMNETRGLSNRFTGNAVFASAEPNQLNSYGSIDIEINLDALRSNEGDLETSLEEPMIEQLQRQALGSIVGVEVGDNLASDGIFEDTLIISRDVPLKYTQATNEDGDVIFTGDSFNQQTESKDAKFSVSQPPLKASEIRENNTQNNTQAFGEDKDTSKTLEEQNAEEGDTPIKDFKDMNTYNRVKKFFANWFSFGELFFGNTKAYESFIRTKHALSSAADISIAETNALIKALAKESGTKVGKLIQEGDHKILFALEEKGGREKLDARQQKIYDMIEKSIKADEQAQKDAGVFKFGLSEKGVKEAIAHINTEIASRTSKKEIDSKTKDEIRSLQKSLDRMTEFQENFAGYVSHVPIVRKFMELKGKARADFAKRLELFVRQREGKYSLRDFTEGFTDSHGKFREAILSPADLNPIQLMAEMKGDAYKRIATTTLVNEMKAAGYIQKGFKGTEGQAWLDASQIKGISQRGLKDQFIHPLVAGALAELSESNSVKKNGFRKLLAITKVGQFFVPGIVLTYDIMQGIQRGMWSANPIKQTKYIIRAFNSVKNQDQDWQTAHKFGLGQKPSIPTIAAEAELYDQLGQSVDATVNKIWKFGSKAVDQKLNLSTKEAMKDFLKNPIDAMMLPYRSIGKVTWMGDDMIRMISYHAMKDLYGDQMTPERMADYAAKAHGAYALPSKQFKDVASLIFFVHTFRLLMPWEHIKTHVTIPKMIYNKVTQGKQINKAEAELAAKALTGTLLTPLAVFMMMTANGWKPDDEGLPEWWVTLKKGTMQHWKFKKTVRGQDGKKRELVTGINTILNMPTKWVERAVKERPEKLNDAWYHVANMFKWEVNPMYRNFLDIATNESSMGGTRPYQPGDSIGKQVLSASKYFYDNTFRMYGEMSRPEMAGAYQRQVKKDLEGALNGYEKVLLGYFTGYKGIAGKFAPLQVGYTYSRRERRARLGSARQALARAISAEKGHITATYRDRPDIRRKKTRELVKIQREREKRLRFIFLGDRTR